MREFDAAWRVFRYMTSTVELMNLPNRITFDSMIEVCNKTGHHARAFDVLFENDELPTTCGRQHAADTMQPTPCSRRHATQ